MSSEIIKKIFYINLDRRPDRNKNVLWLINELNKLSPNFNSENSDESGCAGQSINLYDIPVERISAVDGSKLNLDLISNQIITKEGIYDAKNKKQRVYVPLTPGAIGCALSHKEAWQKIIDENLDNALILEDDIRFDKNFKTKLEQYAHYFPKEYDIIFLGYHPSSFKHLHKNEYNEYIIKTNQVYGLFGYIVSNRGAYKLMEIFPITKQIDTEIHKNFHTIDAYLLKPKNRIIFSDPSENAKQFGTDIQTREGFIANLEHFADNIYYSNWVNEDDILNINKIMGFLWIVLIILIMLKVMALFL